MLFLRLHKLGCITSSYSSVQFVQTDLAAKMDPKFIEFTGGFMPMEMVVKGIYIHSMYAVWPYIVLF